MLQPQINSGYGNKPDTYSENMVPFDTLIVFLKEFFEKVNFERSQQKTIKAWKITKHADLIYRPPDKGA